MQTPRHPTLIRRMAESRVRQLQARGPVLAASLVTIAKQCGRLGCHCQRGEKHRGQYLTYKDKGQTQTVYVPVDLVEEVKRWIKEHRRIKTLIRELSALSVARVRTHVRSRQQRAGRS